MTHAIRSLVTGAVFLLALVMTDAAAQETAQQTPAAPPAVPAKPIAFGAGARAQDPLAPTPPFAALAPGLFARQILESASPSGDYTVQVWSLLVSPKSETGEAKLAGAAVLLLNAGHVEVISAGKRTRLEPGGTTSVAEGASVRFINTNERQPAQLRAVVVSGRR